MRAMIIFLMILILLAACTAAMQDSEAARQALVDFFAALNQGQYDKAIDLFAGSYETLIYWNPDVNSFDLDRLWENGCTINGLQCLEARSATLVEQNGDTFVFTVEFSNPDGSLFVLGPCCGASATEMPPVEQFTYHVVKKDGKYLVLELPVYVP
jgi:hypothetical protein